MDDKTYLRNIGNALTQSINQFQPEFLIYNAGTDILEGDPLGNTSITPEGIIKRDELVFERCLERSGRLIPVVMIMSGGY